MEILQKISYISNQLVDNKQLSDISVRESHIDILKWLKMLQILIKFWKKS